MFIFLSCIKFEKIWVIIFSNIFSPSFCFHIKGFPNAYVGSLVDIPQIS